MGLLEWLRRLKYRGFDISEGTELSEAIRRTSRKAKKHRGDPFSEYRKTKTLPKEYEYGMNCLLNRVYEIDGKESAQRMYEEFKNDPMSSNKIIEVPDRDLLGSFGILFPPLFGVGNLRNILDFSNKPLDGIKQEFISQNFFIPLSILIEGLQDDSDKDRFVVRVKLEKSELDKFEKYSDKLSGKILVFLKSKEKKYYDFLEFREFLNGYIYHFNGRCIELSIDKLSDIIILINKSDKEKYFKEGRDISSEEGSNIDVVWNYTNGKPSYREGKYLAILENDQCHFFENGKEIHVGLT